MAAFTHADTSATEAGKVTEISGGSSSSVVCDFFSSFTIGTLTKIDTGAQLIETGVGRAWLGAGDATYVGGISTTPQVDLNTLLMTDSPVFSFIGFRCSQSAGDSTWKCVSNNAGTQTVVDSGVAADTGFHRFSVAYSGGTLTFSIDGNAVGTITTNLPSAALALSPIVWVDNAPIPASTFVMAVGYQRWFVTS